MLTKTTLLAILATATTTLALPTTSSAAVTARDETNLTTKATYYQGGTTATACNIAVSSDSLDLNTCHQALVYGIGIQQLEDRECTYTLYQGSKSCGDDATSVSNITIPMGNDTTCVDAGVYDGGFLAHASGKWTC